MAVFWGMYEYLADGVEHGLSRSLVGFPDCRFHEAEDVALLIQVLRQDIRLQIAEQEAEEERFGRG